jgi:hypothetical protein
MVARTLASQMFSWKITFHFFTELMRYLPTIGMPHHSQLLLLSLQRFSPKAIEFLFCYDELCPPHKQAHALGIQRKYLFLIKE